MQVRGVLGLALLTTSLVVVSWGSGPRAGAADRSPRSGIARSGFDAQARPQDDLFRHVNGGWLAEGMATLPLSTLAGLNTRMLKYFIKRYAMRRGALMFGKMLPVGIGAAVGGAGNRMVGKKIVGNARRAFGAPPARWPNTLHVLPAVHEVSK